MRRGCRTDLRGPAYPRTFALAALEVAIGDMTERTEVLAAGEVCNLLLAALRLEAVSYWDDSE